jgi:hypothetical protein
MVLDALYDSGSFLPDKETGAIMNNRFVESDGTLVDWNGLLEYLQAWEEIIGECYKK